MIVTHRGTRAARGGEGDPESIERTLDLLRNAERPLIVACCSSDVILALGVSFDDRATSSWMQGVTYTIPPTKLIQVDVGSDEIGRNYPVEVPIIGDEKLVVS